VPLYILGSSWFGAQLMAAFGLPFAFASAAVNLIAADTTERAQLMLHLVKRARVSLLYGPRGRSFTGEEAALVIESDAGRQIEQMLR